MPKKMNPYKYVPSFLHDLDIRIKAEIKPTYFEYDKDRDIFYVGIFDYQNRCVGCYTVPGKEMDEYIRANGLDHRQFLPEKSFKEGWERAETNHGSYPVYQIEKKRGRNYFLKGREEIYGLSSLTYIDPDFVEWIKDDFKKYKYRVFAHGATGLVCIYADNDNFERIALIAPTITPYKASEVY